MEKDNTTEEASASWRKKVVSGKCTIGLDLGDRSSSYCVLDEHAQVLKQGTIATTQKGLNQVFGALPRAVVAIEAGTHSPWVSRHLKKLGHDVIVANPRRVRLIAQSRNKHDRLDAETLARLAHADPQLLYPIRHRSETAQADLTMIRVRAGLVESRTALINTARGLTKSFGERLPKCDAAYLNAEFAKPLPDALRQALEPLLEQIAELTKRIKSYDAEIEKIAAERYPEVELLTRVQGVGTLIALTFILTIDDATRFGHSREVGSFLGLRPGRRESGKMRRELGITKEGDVYLRKLLVQSAHVILGRRGGDSDLRRWGLKLASRGVKNAKKRARVAVARKLGVLLHYLWVNGVIYEPLHNSREQEAKAA